jgi:hypothetical protein
MTTPARARTKPALVDFARGYLHEDYLEEYGSLAAAANAYVSEATPRDVARLRRDLELLIEASREWPIARLREFVATELGSAWRPVTRKDLTLLLQAVPVPDDHDPQA